MTFDYGEVKGGIHFFAKDLLNKHKFLVKLLTAPTLVLFSKF